MATLRRADLAADPAEQFRRWFDEAGPAEPVALATATRDGRPSARMVLLKGFADDGFRFFSNYESRKGHELAENPRAALLFHWSELGRQVRVEGGVDQLAAEESDAYFASRPHESQISAAASPQSRVVSSRDELERRVGDLRDRAGEGTIARPPNWGGYLLRPEAYEFWQHRDNRLHDRFRYRAEGEAWVVERLGP
jgi:pyridoxamine 5'-phosphate oxidase